MNKFIKSFSVILTVAALTIGMLITPNAQAVSYTAEQVATHNTAADCWVIVNNNVYNLTSFIPTHPGGSAVIIAVCGKDGTAAFNSGPHTTGALSSISSLLLGTLASTTVPVLTSVSLTPSTPSVIVGGTLQLTATPKDQDGVAFVGATNTFTSSDVTKVTVNNSGLAMGVSPGSASISVSSSSGTAIVGSSINIVVTSSAVTPVLTSVILTPGTPSITVGGTVQLTATPKDQSGVAFVGATTTYVSNNPAIMTVSNSGLVTGVSAGTATVTASTVSGSTTVTGTSVVTVTTSATNNPLAPVISGLTAPTALNIGEVGTWMVKASDPQNRSLSYSVDWGEASMQTMAMSAANNFVQTATFTHSYTTAGIYTIKFTVMNDAGLTTLSTVTVNVGSSSSSNPSKLGSIALIANDYEVDVGSTQQMKVVYKDLNENPFDGTAVNTTYSSSDPSVATVDSNGLVKGVSAGTTTITAISVSGSTTVSDTALMTVTPGYEGNSGSNNNQNTNQDANNQNTHRHSNDVRSLTTNNSSQNDNNDNSGNGGDRGNSHSNNNGNSRADHGNHNGNSHSRNGN